MTPDERCKHPKPRYALERRVEGIVLALHCDDCEASARAANSVVLPYVDAKPISEEEWDNKFDPQRRMKK